MTTDSLSRPFVANVIRHPRLTLSPFGAEEMLRFGVFALNMIASRIQSATDVRDQPAKPLSPGYLKRKTNPKRGEWRAPGKPVRDWTFYGRTMRSLKVKRATENGFVIGPTTAQADQIITIQNRACKMWGVSPNDFNEIRAELRRIMTRHFPIIVKYV